MKHFISFLLFSIVFWNVENCFDYFDGGFSPSDSEFSSRGVRHWTKRKFEDKMEAIGKTILWCGTMDSASFSPPWIVGLAEIENDFVLRHLCRSDVLRKFNYRFVHFESRDTRGIDVALLYLEDRLEPVRCYPLPILRRDDCGQIIDTLATRDILYACLRERESGLLWHVFVNHHPSKYGGAESSPKRMAAMRTLRSSVDSLLAAGQTRIVAMGDFNDTPDAAAFAEIDGALVNLGTSLEGQGSIRYRGKWQLIDNFLVSPDLQQKRMEVLRPPFLIERDRQFPGDKPRRTYVGPRYNGGVSDHLPVMLR